MLRIMYGNFNGSADIIPVDIAVNLIIAAAWSTAIERYCDALRLFRVKKAAMQNIH